MKTIEINNLTEKQKRLGDLMWQYQEIGALNQALSQLSPKTRREANCIAYLMVAGGDRVENTTEAKSILDRISKL